MTQQSLSQRAPLPYPEFLTLCALVMASTALATDIILPAMLVIGEDLGAGDGNAVQLVVTAYLLPYALGQLMLGTLTDSFGRKPVMLIGMGIHATASILSILATSFEELLWWRALAGFSAASGRIGITAVVRDCFSGRDMASVMSVVMSVFMVVPIAAPLLGQILTELAGWPAVFIFMGTFSFCLAGWIAIRLPETLSPEKRRPFNVSGVAGAFHLVLTNRLAFGYAAGLAVYFGCLFGFINSAPQIYLDVYGLGWLFPLAFSAGSGLVAAASLVNARAVRRLGMRRLSHGSLVLFILLGCAMLAFSIIYDGRPPVWGFVAGCAAMLLFFGFIGTNFQAMAMEPLGAVAGTASAVFGFVQIGLAAIVGAIIGQLFDGTTIPLIIGFITCGLASLFLAFWAESGRLFTDESRSS